MPEKYIYTASTRLGDRVVQPLGRLKVSWEKVEDEFRAGYKKKLSGTLSFIGEDFVWFYTLEKSGYRCEYMPIVIQKYCGGIYIENWQTGRISYNNGTWDLDKCIVDFEVEVDDDYTCYEDGKQDEINLFLSIANRETINLVSGTIENYSCTKTFPGGIEDPDPCPQPDGSGWTLWRQKITITYATGRVEEYEYVRYDLGGGEYAPGIVYAPVNTYTSDAFGNVSETIYSIAGNDGYINEIDNGMKLQEVFQAFISELCSGKTVKSDFFQWDADNITDTNYVTGESSKVKNLILFQKSDVKRPLVSSNATIAEISFDDLLKNICTLFNLQWDIDSNYFRIEHISYWNRNPGLNLTESKYAQYVAFKRKYSYATDKMFKYEQFKCMEAQGIDFIGRDISYDSACVVNAGADAKKYEADKITTDVGLCLSSPDSDSAIVSDSGFVLVACDEDNVVITEAPILTPYYQVNNSLAWAQLHRDYYKHGRMLLEGNMNGEITTFLSSIKTKKQQSLSIPLCCDETFDPFKLIKTAIGDEGDVLQATFDLKSEMLQVECIFDANVGLTVNEAPVAVNDSASTAKNNSIDIAILENDSDSDGTLIPSSIIIVSNPLHGIVVINSNGTVTYAPELDYVGSDYFYYTVKDEWGETSNIALVNITVTATAVAVDDTIVAFKNETRIIPAPGVLANDIGSGLFVSAFDHFSVNGGVCDIGSDGLINYTPASDYTGPDSFTYTIDSGGFTDTATVNITVKERVMIYTKLVQSLVETIPITAMCSGILTEIGRKEKSDITILYYSDLSGTVPVDIEGYGLSVNVRRHTVYNHTGATSNSDGAFTTGSGTSKLYLDNAETHRDIYACDGSYLGTDYDDTYSLLAGTGYTII